MRIGSLFSGAGGLDMAVESVFGGEVVWQSEVDKAASAVLAHRWPNVPNLGDITAVDWDAVAPVDVLCGGFPCQDVSAAGKRAGIKHGTRSGLWSVFADVIDHLRPTWVVIENVRGLLSARAHRNLEPTDGVVGKESDGPVLRAAGAVLGDLADLGYDAQWATVAAADVGAPHRRERVFILARRAVSYPGHDAGCAEQGVEHEAEAGRVRKSSDRAAAHANQVRPEGCGLSNGVGTAQPKLGRSQLPLCAQCGHSKHEKVCAGFLWQQYETPRRCECNASDSPSNGWDEGRPESARLVGGFDAAVSGDEPGVALLPTPQAHDSQGPKTPEQIAAMPAKGAGVRNLNETAVHELLSTPQSRDYKGRPSDGFNQANLCRDVALMPNPSAWGKYEPAIRRWESLTGSAPAPTEPNKNGNPRLSAAFSEWLMGWPAGWVTDPAIGISRNDQLRIVGNGVCPQQAVAALRFLLTVSEVAA